MSVHDAVDLMISEHGRDEAEEILSERYAGSQGEEQKQERILKALSTIRQRGDA